MSSVNDFRPTANYFKIFELDFPWKNGSKNEFHVPDIFSCDN